MCSMRTKLKTNMNYICENCGKEFYPKDKYHLKRNTPKFCSKKCIKVNSQFKKGEGYWTGKKRPPRSKEWQNKINRSLIGNTFGKKLKGIKKPIGFGEKIRRAQLGNKHWLDKHHTLKSRKKCSISKLGNKNPNWKGGVYNPRNINSFKYTLWREKIFIRDNFTCQICNNVGGNLNAHHIQAWVKFKKLRYKIDNGITLCVKCHKSIHKKYGK